MGACVYGLVSRCWYDYYLHTPAKDQLAWGQSIGFLIVGFNFMRVGIYWLRKKDPLENDRGPDVSR